MAKDIIIVVTSNRRDDFEHKLAYAGDLLGPALDLFSKVWREFPEFRDEVSEKLWELLSNHLLLEDPNRRLGGKDRDGTHGLKKRGEEKGAGR